MSIRQGLLALLEQGPMYGYQLRAEFESRTGATWPLNVGQVYTTLAGWSATGWSRPPATTARGTSSTGSPTAGRAEVATWFSHAGRAAAAPPRDELAIKLAMAVTVPGVDVRAVVQGQRTATIRALQDYTRLKARATEAPRPADLAWLLVLDSLVFAAEAEVRWLDHCEARLRPARGSRRAGARAGAVGRTPRSCRTTEEVRR